MANVGHTLGYTDEDGLAVTTYGCVTHNSLVSSKHSCNLIWSELTDTHTRAHTDAST